jgi:hypothetical protein
MGIHGKDHLQNRNTPNPEVFMDSTFALVALMVIIALAFD